MPADQARITIARDLLAQLGVTLADLRGDGTPASSVPTLADYLPCVIASAAPGANRTYGSYWTRMAAAWGTRPLDQISASDIEAMHHRMAATARSRRNIRARPGPAESATSQNPREPATSPAEPGAALREAG